MQTGKTRDHPRTQLRQLCDHRIAVLGRDIETGLHQVDRVQIPNCMIKPPSSRHRAIASVLA
jgi:hypothetical protein